MSTVPNSPRRNPGWDMTGRVMVHIDSLVLNRFERGIQPTLADAVRREPAGAPAQADVARAVAAGVRP